VCRAANPEVTCLLVHMMHDGFTLGWRWHQFDAAVGQAPPHFAIPPLVQPGAVR
jgi:hypothetical protein